MSSRFKLNFVLINLIHFSFKLVLQNRTYDLGGRGLNPTEGKSNPSKFLKHRGGSFDPNILTPKLVNVLRTLILINIYININNNFKKHAHAVYEQSNLR